MSGPATPSTWVPNVTVVDGSDEEEHSEGLWEDAPPSDEDENEQSAEEAEQSGDSEDQGEQSDHTYALAGHTMTLDTGDVLEIQSTVHIHRGIVGRGTKIYRVKLKKAKTLVVEPKDKILILKVYWPLQSSTPEAEIIKAATALAKRHPGYDWVLDHLPGLIHSEESPPSPIDVRFAAVIGDSFKMRVMRVLVQEELYPITLLTTAIHVLHAMKGIFKCYRWLYEKANIMYSDISLSNSMYRVRNGLFYGVLNDMALSWFLNGTIGERERTSGLPFFNVDTFAENPIVYTYRHGLESLFYVFVWLTFRYHEGEEIDSPPFEEWNVVSKDRRPLRVAKESFLSSELGQPTEHFVPLYDCLQRMQIALRDGYAARKQHEEIEAPENAEVPPFDQETLGGHVSFDVFEEILNSSHV